MSLFSQDYIGGVVNSYYEVSSVGVNGVSLVETNLSDLKPGDKCILIQMSGVQLNKPAGYEIQNGLTYSDFKNAGVYELLTVLKINDVSKSITFTEDIKVNFSAGEKIQLIKIYESHSAIVSSDLTAMPWNGSKGGVLALIAYDKLTLNANIDVSAKGYRGGTTADYNDGLKCKSDTFYFNDSRIGAAGKKGEGLIEVGWTDNRGPGRLINGGGSGIGKFSGGAGGSNYGRGGGGGLQVKDCSEGIFSIGGIELTELNNFYVTGKPRVIMGGGGGCSTQDPSHPATDGGDGGGIIIIMTDTLDARGYTISSNGGSVGGSALGGAGGGGAGGSVFIDAKDYIGNLNIEVKGGDGGNTGSTSTGAGGSGGGGVFWFSQVDMPSEISVSMLEGASGTAINTPQFGSKGTRGARFNLLKLPFNGFLYNAVKGDDTICEGDVPKEITGNIPRGGGSYNYSWIESTDSVNWLTANGVGDSLSFQPDKIYTTTYYTRIVESEGIYDTALAIKVMVTPSIQNNKLNFGSTLCYGNSPGTLSSDSIYGAGGEGTYQYSWQSSIDSINWISRGNFKSLEENELYENTYYRLVITSKACEDTSNIESINVLPTITGNEFYHDDTAACYQEKFFIIKPNPPIGGDGTYKYRWLESQNGDKYNPITNAFNPELTIDSILADHYYKRVVYSGNDSTCIDTSKAYIVRSVPNISNNTINIGETLYCHGDTIQSISGSLPEGGSGSFAYQWIKKITTDDNWEEINGSMGRSFIEPMILDTSINVSRVVKSGTYDACLDTSSSLVINVKKEIKNNLVTSSLAICEMQAPGSFNEPPASGGEGIFTYQWENKTDQEKTWSLAPIDSSDNTLPSYTATTLNETTSYRRIVQSGSCKSVSDTITVTVFDSIKNNLILGGDTLFNCYNTSLSIQGSEFTGGDQNSPPTYIWQKSENQESWAKAEGIVNGEFFETSPLLDSSYFRRIIHSGENAACKDTSSSIPVKIHLLPEGEITNAQDSICEGEYTKVEYKINEGKFPISISLGDSLVAYTESDITSDSGTIMFSPNESGMYRMLDLVDDNTCHADTSTTSGVIDINVTKTPKPFAGEDKRICSDSVDLNATPSIGQGYWSSKEGNLADSLDPNSNFTVENYKEYTLYWIETNLECQGTDTVKITFDQQPSEAFAGYDEVLNYKFEYMLNANMPEIGHGVWRSINGDVIFEDSTIHNTMVFFENIGNYALLWKTENGVCKPSTDTVQIQINDIKIYKGFSPNEDGINDTFLIKLSGKTSFSLHIIDTWGNLIYKEKATDIISWDGTNIKGVEVPEGTYYYILEEKGGRTRKGYIELRR